MKTYFTIFLILCAVILGVWYVGFKPQVVETPKPIPMVSKTYSNGTEGFSIRLPEGFTVDEHFVHQITPQKNIAGVKFTIPQDLSKGTNLSNDSYISVETIPNVQDCSANLFLDGAHNAEGVTDSNGVKYSLTSSSGAGAGNRYDETVYALAGTNPCIAVRYLIHYGVIENYPEGTVKEFDKQALVTQFDQIRRTLVVNQ